MFEMHLKQPGFTYSVCGPFSKKQRKNPKVKKTGDWPYIYRNEEDKSCFRHDMAYGVFKDLIRRTASKKILRDKAFYIAEYPKYYRYWRDLTLMNYKFSDKKSSGSGIENEKKVRPASSGLSYATISKRITQTND